MARPENGIPVYKAFPASRDHGGLARPRMASNRFAPGRPAPGGRPAGHRARVLVRTVSAPSVREARKFWHDKLAEVTATPCELLMASIIVAGNLLP